MSLFKEKDDYITAALKNQFDHSDSEDSIEIGDALHDTTSNSPKRKEPKLEEQSEDIKPNQNDICYFDVSGSPSPNIITIGSDDETSNGVELAQETISMNQGSSLHDLEDNEFTLKIFLAGSMHRFDTTYKKKLIETLKDLLDEFRSRGKDLILTSESETISLNESPHSLGLKTGVILHAIEVSDHSGTTTSINSRPQSIDPDEITVKLQDGNRKNNREFRLKKTEPVVNLKKLYAKEFKIQCSDEIKLSFDGDLLEDDATLEEQDIDDDCAIDVLLNNSSS